MAHPGPPPAFAPLPSPYGPPGNPYRTPGPAEPRPFGAIAAVQAVFDDPEWKMNVLLGVVFSLIPVLGPIALSGWLAEVHQRLVHRHPRPVPKLDFSDLFEYFKRGIPIFLVGLVMVLPVMFLFWMVAAAAGFGTVAVLAATNEPLAGIAVGAIGGIFAIFAWLCMNVLLNAASTRAELTENFGEALKFGELMAYSKATFGKVVVKTFTFGFVSFGIVLLGMLACYIGLYPAIIVIQIASLHLRNMIYEDYLASGGQPIAVKQLQPLPSEAPPRPAYAPGY
jgi:hypothetical protein